MTPKTSFPKNKISVLLLENIHQSAITNFENESFQVESLPGSLDPEELKVKIENAHIIGIRSKTQLTDEIIAAGKRLLGIGAFCIGTNQIDLDAAADRGIPVFNAPFSNTRSVAELIISHCIALYRGVAVKNEAAHKGEWLKSADGSHEVRGKTLGVVGYGHIGSQVSVMAEAMGMKVLFYDILDKLALGNATSAGSLDELLKVSDIVTLHVPGTVTTKNMFDRSTIAKMKDGSYLLNYSRGDVVDLDALADEIKSGRLAGAAVDVFPVEPKAKGEQFSSPLQGLSNVILTPHVGGSTLEAQAAIGGEVSNKLNKFINNGSTTMSVNVPEVELPIHAGMHRILHFHENIPGVLQEVNALFGAKHVNVLGQYLMTNARIGFLVMDVSNEVEKSTLDDLNKVSGTIRTRILY